MILELKVKWLNAQGIESNGKKDKAVYLGLKKADIEKWGCLQLSLNAKHWPQTRLICMSLF